MSTVVTSPTVIFPRKERAIGRARYRSCSAPRLNTEMRWTYALRASAIVELVETGGPPRLAATQSGSGGSVWYPDAAPATPTRPLLTMPLPAEGVRGFTSLGVNDWRQARAQLPQTCLRGKYPIRGKALGAYRGWASSRRVPWPRRTNGPGEHGSPDPAGSLYELCARIEVPCRMPGFDYAYWPIEVGQHYRGAYLQEFWVYQEFLLADHTYLPIRCVAVPRRFLLCQHVRGRCQQYRPIPWYACILQHRATARRTSGGLPGGVHGRLE
ncbi:hypothetical protein ACUXSM_004676 [Burkholderia sp. 132550021-2]|uniref:Uncharacterized protein n=1 Tax=Burkholderia stabilis TaxID=95485 RepID=A0AAJ5NF90_9BURK|nr:hypothetical protein BSTAB16_7579 [Burkholderia stabilis]